MSELRLLSYNVHRLSGDVDALVKVIRSAVPDVVYLQEAPRRLRWRYRCAELARRCGMLVASGGGSASGNLLLTTHRVVVHESWSMRYPLTPGRHIRGAAFARCSVGKSRILIAGSHLSTDPAERPGQAALLRAALGAAEEPVLLGADLNDVPSGLAWRTVADGRIDAAVVRKAGDVPTFSVTVPTRRVDAIFVDPRCLVTSYEVLDSAEIRRASDHFPVLATVALPDTG